MTRNCSSKIICDLMIRMQPRDERFSFQMLFLPSSFFIFFNIYFSRFYVAEDLRGSIISKHLGAVRWKLIRSKRQIINNT